MSQRPHGVVLASPYPCQRPAIIGPVGRLPRHGGQPEHLGPTVLPGELPGQCRCLPTQIIGRSHVAEERVRALDMQEDAHREQLAYIPSCLHAGMHVTDQRGQLATDRLVITPTLIYY